MASRGNGAVSMRVEDERVRKALNRSRVGLSTQVRKVFNSTGVALVALMRRKLEDHGKVDRGDSGGLLGAIDYEVSDRRGRMALTAGPGVTDDSFMAQAETLEHGRGEGKPRPAPGELLPWMGRKGIPDEAEYPIAKKIGEEGLKGQPFPFMGPAFDEMGPIADGALAAIGDGIVREFEA